MTKKRFTKELENYIFNKVSTMKSSTLIKEISNCGSLTQTNCGWLEYRFRDLIKGVLENELELKRLGNRSNSQEA
jgi:hypothetical protein